MRQCGTYSSSGVCVARWQQLSLFDSQTEPLPTIKRQVTGGTSIQAEFHRKMQAHWDALLPQIESLEATEVSGGHGQHQGAFELLGSEAGTAAKAVDLNLAADGLDDLQP
ncbi:MAG: hypothetical protein ACPIOQ_01515 [Promethearchaeia archaeon]